jgi:hypothetical protein
LPFVWKIYNELEDVIDVLEESDIEINVTDSVELTDTDKDIALSGIYNTIIGDSADNQARVEMIDAIIGNVLRLYRVDIEVSEADTDDPQDKTITVHVGMIDDKWLILSETMQ